VEQHRAAALVLVHEAAVLEVADEGGAALDAGVGDVADLFAVELVPAALVEAAHQRRDVVRRQHVDEGIPHVALVLEVDGQVEEIKRALEVLLDGLVEGGRKGTGGSTAGTKMGQVLSTVCTRTE
jgi:hypothetical protein